MKRHTTVTLLASLVLALATFAFAQDEAAAGIRIAFVDTQSLIRSHPANADIERLGTELESELNELTRQREQLLAKRQSQGLTAEEEELLQALTTTIQTRQQSGVEEIRGAAAPAEQAANEVIREIALAEGYALVLDIEQASGLVVFAADTVPDITQQAIQMIQERFPQEE